MIEALTKQVARGIIERVGGPGQPPDYGFQYFTAGLDAYLDVIEREYLSDYVKSGGSSFKLVVGVYGGGKTHLLYSIRELAWNDDFVASYIELRQGSSPFHKLEEVYKAIVKHVAHPQSPDEILGGQSIGIESLLRASLERQRKHYRDQGAQSDEIDPLIDAWIQGFSRFDSISFQKAIRAAFAALIEDRDEEFETICQWIRGEGYVRGVHGKFGILQKVDKTTAFSMIRSLIQLMTDLGYSGLVVLLDEAEQAGSLNTRQRETLLSNLRELIDEVGRSDFKHAMFFYAVPDENFLQHRGQVYEALNQRLRTTFNRTNPSGVKIMLDDVWAEPIDMLVEIGRKLSRVFETATGVALDQGVLEDRVRAMAEEAYEERYGDVGYRRVFVQRMVEQLHEIAAAGAGSAN